MDWQEQCGRDFEELCREPLPWEALRGRQVLMTGATGFLGRYFAQTLCLLNRAKGLGMDLYLFCRKSRYRDGGLPEFRDGGNVQWLPGGIAEDFLPDDVNPDIIIHAASPAKRKDPQGLLDTNIYATYNLLEHARARKSVFLYISSGEVYQRHGGLIAETEFSALENTCLSANPYSLSKAGGELLCADYHQKHGVDCRVIRPFSIYGPGENPETGRCFVDFLSQARHKDAVHVTGDGTRVRSYCDLFDFARGLLYILLKGESTVYNLGNEDNACTIYELAQMIAASVGKPCVLDRPSQGPEGGGEADSYLPDTGRLRALGWLPKVGLEEVILRSMEGGS